jgi:CARDB protein
MSYALKVCLALSVLAAGMTAGLAAMDPEAHLLPPQTAQTSGLLYPAVSDRFGVGVNRTYGLAADYAVAQLGAGWYVDWGTQLDPAYPAGLDYMQMVRVSGDTFSPGLSVLAAIARANPGMTWIIGNEPDSVWQDNSTPEQYARVYHQLYSCLKSIDPTSRVAIGGIVQVTPLRLQWLDAVLDAYLLFYGQPFPTDLWNIHTFVLQEKSCVVYPLDCWGAEIPPGVPASSGVTEGWGLDEHDRLDLVAGQIERFREWMRDHGERDKELIVSEYGILMPDSFGYDAQRVQAFMIGTFDLFLTAMDPDLGCPADGNRLVQRWAWYSLNDKRFEGYTSHSHLFDPATRVLTLLGAAYRDYVIPLYGTYVDVLPAALAASPSPLLALDGQPITVTLTTQVRNGGNVDAGNTSARFWVGAPGQSIGSVQVVPGVPARALVSASAAWTDVPVGVYTVGVTIDGEGAIVESDEGNNQASWRLLIAEHAAYMPLVTRGW